MTAQFIRIGPANINVLPLEPPTSTRPMYAAHCYHNQNHIVRVDGNLVPLDLMLKFYPFLHDRVKRSYIKNKVAFFKATPEISFFESFLKSIYLILGVIFLNIYIR